MIRKGGSNWVDGENFFDRKTELEALEERVREGTHTLLTAQRRMGKTSLVRELQRRLAETRRLRGRLRRPGGGHRFGRRHCRNRGSGEIRARGVGSDHDRLRESC